PAHALRLRGQAHRPSPRARAQIARAKQERHRSRFPGRATTAIAPEYERVERVAPMADAREPAKPPKAPLGSLDEVQILWDIFRAGGVVSCPADQAALALSVDGAFGAYRF